jgi:hypothetical protein
VRTLERKFWRGRSAPRAHVSTTAQAIRTR